MKKLTLTLLTLTIMVCASAQAPQALNYQAVARNSLGQIVPSQNVGVRFTISDATGNITYYQETHTTTTNNFGLFTLAIGKGTAVSGAIAPIDWSAGGDKYLKVEIAPQGGTNYTIQGTTQLLSVPYALYAEKTRLIGGNAITITNGNTINANYIAGPGIIITGNTISATAGNSWLLNGNAGTTAGNFLGTTDNKSLRIRTNNINRVTIDSGIVTASGNSGSVLISDFNSMDAYPGQLAVFGKDIPGVSMSMHLFNSVAGMNWAPQGGANNTMGRFFRLSQYTSNNLSLGEFFDFGMDQGKSFFISEHGIQNQGPTLFKKMFTISPQDFVGINFNWGENPTANFHTKGTVRFEGVNANNALTRIVAMDANGNVASRDAGTLIGGFWVADANGIHNNNAGGHIGIGGSSSSLHTLNVEMMEGTIDGRGTAKFLSNDTWQTNVRIDNPTVDRGFSLVMGGSGNTLLTYGVGAGNMGIAQGPISTGTSTIPLIITSNNFVGISNSNGGTNNMPKSRLHVRDGDINIDQVGSGVIMKSPNGQCWRMTVSDAGTPVFTAITCP